VIVLAFFASKLIANADQTPPPSFSGFLKQLDAGQIKTATMKTKDNSIDVTLRRADRNKYSVGYPLDYSEVLVNKMRAAEDAGKLADFDVKPARSSVIVSLLTYILPFVLFIGFWIFLMNQVQGGGSKVMSFGKSRAKRLSVDSPKITFRDVAGVDEAVEELHEIKEFLENPKKFQALGARIPKGVLLYGPPGTGKTLLARAVAGEAGVPFFSISARTSSRCSSASAPAACRDLFEQAKQNSPCIIFMDEIDAVGRHRGAGLGGGHDEREQTLNQLLVEMDGFEAKDNIIMIAATNRPDILDPALLRPGPLRPPDHRRPAGPQGPREDPRGPHARQAAGQGDQHRRAGRPDARLHRRRPLQPRQRGRPARRPLGQEGDRADRARGGHHARGRGSREEDPRDEREGAPRHRVPRDGPRDRRPLPRALRPGPQDLDHQPRPGARLHDLAAGRGQVPHHARGADGHDGDDARAAAPPRRSSSARSPPARPTTSRRSPRRPSRWSCASA
jgi:AAA+ superfamily predicted ATPase